MANALKLTPGNSNLYLGNDGNWKPYTLSVGSTQQPIQVLPSTSLADTWGIAPGQCPSNKDLGLCLQQRGGTFDPSVTNTWTSIGRYTLGIGQSYGWNQDVGSFGQDNIIIPLTNQGTIPVMNVTVGSVNTTATALGFLGLHSKQLTFNITSTANPSGTDVYYNSTLQVMKNDNLIPSLSYSYSAGSWYNATNGVLVLGGYDASTFIPNDVEFNFAADIDHYLSINLQSITTTSGTNKTTLSDGALQILVDSDTAQLWLPQTVCDNFASAFGLEYRQIDQLYTISNSTRQTNLKNNPSVTFTISNTTTSTDVVTITLPYKAFDFSYFQVSNPSSSANTLYFPLKVASDQTQYTLGRTFLQEAVLTVDHERKKFSLAQVVDLRNNQTPSLQNILSTTSPQTSNTPSVVSNPNGGSGGSGGGFPTGAIAGIVIAVVVIIAAIAGFLFWRRRRNQKQQYAKTGTTDPDTPGPRPLPPAPINEKTPASHELHTPRAGSSADYFGASAYATSLSQHHKAAMSNNTNELEGHAAADRGRARSPAPAYVPTITESPAAGGVPVELPAGMHAQELHSRHVSSTFVPNQGLIPSPASSPPVNSPISELAPSPGEDGPGVSPTDMGWNSPIEPATASTIPEDRAFPSTQGTAAQDLRSNRAATSTTDHATSGSSRGYDTLGGMSATSGPLGLGLGMPGDREPSESLRRNDSTRSRTSRASDSTLVGNAAAGAGALHSQGGGGSAAIPRKPLRDS